MLPRGREEEEGGCGLMRKGGVNGGGFASAFCFDLHFLSAAAWV